MGYMKFLSERHNHETSPSIKPSLLEEEEMIQKRPSTIVDVTSNYQHARVGFDRKVEKENLPR